MTDGVGPAVMAAVDRIIPADQWPGGWEGGVGSYLRREDPQLAWAWPLLESLEQRLTSIGFVALDETAQDAALSAIGDDPVAATEFAALRRLCWEGYYALTPGHRAAGLEMIGFRSVPAGVEPVEPEPPRTVGVADLAPRYDVVVVGSGPGGAAAARVLAAAGKAVLVVERAAARSQESLRNDHLRDKRAAVYRPSAGPGAGHPRVQVVDGVETVVDGDEDAARYGLNAMLYGGGTRVWQGMAWRFLPEDFRMCEVYGQPAGSSLADWPVSYEELEPYYARAESELGVAGEMGDLTRRTPRSGSYPMPAMGTEPARELLADAARRLGWGHGPVPLALNSVPRDGRAACVRCAQCVGHACPVDAKNGAQNTLLPRALSDGAELLLEAQALRVTEFADRVEVLVVAQTATAPREIRLVADLIVVSAGAIETPRLLLASGLGNDILGRNLHDHRFGMVLGMLDRPAKTWRGPGHSIATLDHAHADSIPWGGAVLSDVMTMLPLSTASAPPVPGVPAWGLGHKEWMREGRERVFGVFGIGQEIPVARSRVDLASGVVDRWGVPAARMRKEIHWASREVDAGMFRIAGEWLRAAGARHVAPRVAVAGGTPSAAGEHSCGTARMGEDPRTSATGPDGRLHGTRRVHVADASLHPTNGSVNPTLTIIANSMRVADRILADWP